MFNILPLPLTALSQFLSVHHELLSQEFKLHQADQDAYKIKNPYKSTNKPWQESANLKKCTQSASSIMVILKTVREAYILCISTIESVLNQK